MNQSMFLRIWQRMLNDAKWLIMSLQNLSIFEQPSRYSLLVNLDQDFTREHIPEWPRQIRINLDVITFSFLNFKTLRLQIQFVC